MAAVALGTALATALAGVLGDFAHWRVVFAIPAVLAVACAIGLGRVHEESREAQAGAFALILDAVWNRWVLAVIGLAFMEGAVVLGVLTLLAPALQSQGVGAGGAGLATAAYGIGVIGATRLVRVVSRSVPMPGLMAIGGCAAVSGYAVLAVHVSIVSVIAAALLLGITLVVPALLAADVGDRRPAASAGNRGRSVRGVPVRRQRRGSLGGRGGGEQPAVGPPVRRHCCGRAAGDGSGGDQQTGLRIPFAGLTTRDLPHCTPLRGEGVYVLVRVQSAGLGDDPQCDIDGPAGHIGRVLRAQCRFGERERCAERGDAGDCDGTRLHLLCPVDQSLSCFAQLLAAQLIRAHGGPAGEVREADAA